MVNQILVLNRFDAEEFDCPYDWACISIANTESDFAEIPTENRRGLLQLAFIDAIHPIRGFHLFDDEDAYEILDFITHCWEKVGTLMVHCDAGISRSSAVAAAIARLKFEEESEFWEPPFDPNPRVYRILREVATGRGDYQDW